MRFAGSVGEQHLGQFETPARSLNRMREPKAIPTPRINRRRSPGELPRPSAKHADELMELAVEAAQSRQLPDFLRRFAQRAARMLNAQWGGVTVFRGRETDLYTGGEADALQDATLTNWLVQCARENKKEIAARGLPPN